MESNRKRKGFMKGKLVMSFYRASKQSSTLQYLNNKNPKPSHPPPSTALVGYIINQQNKVIPQPIKHAVYSSTPSVGFVVNQDKNQVIAQPKQTVSFVLPDNNNPYGVAGDEYVDAKAASYISCVQERFRLERVNSERNKFQDIQ